MGNFKKLRVWQKAKDLAVRIYKLTDQGQFNPPSRKASADAKDRYNWLRRARKLGSSVLAPFLESRACSGIHTI